FYTVAERLARLDEACQVLKALWTQDKVTLKGRYYQLSDAPLAPKPVQRPYPELMIGGGGEKVTLKIAARHADHWNVRGGPAPPASAWCGFRRCSFRKTPGPSLIASCRRSRHTRHRRSGCTARPCCGHRGRRNPRPSITSCSTRRSSPGRSTSSTGSAVKCGTIAGVLDATPS